MHSTGKLTFVWALVTALAVTGPGALAGMGGGWAAAAAQSGEGEQSGLEFDDEGRWWETRLAASDSLLYVAGEPESAIAMMHRTIDLAAEHYGLEDTTTAFLLMVLGQYFEEIDVLDSAEVYYRQSLALCRQLWPAGSPALSSPLINLGSALMKHGKYDEALQVYRESYDVVTAQVQPNQRLLGFSCRGQGIVYRDMGSFVQARHYLEQAITAFAVSPGKDDPQYAHALGSLAALFMESGSFYRANEVYQEAESLLTINGGELESARMRMNRCNVLWRMGQYGYARYGLEHIRDEWLEAYGPVDQDVAKVQFNLANVISDIGLHEQAIGLYQQAITAESTLFGGDYPGLADSYDAVAGTYGVMHKTDTAILYAEKALAIRRGYLADDHPDVAISYLNLSSLHLEKEEFDTALAWNRRAEAIVYGDTAQTSYLRGSVYSNRADIMLGMKNYAAADSLYQLALVAWEQMGETYESSHPDLALAVERRALLHRLTGRAAEACSLYGDAYGRFSDNFRYNALFMSESDAIKFSTLYRHCGCGYLSAYAGIADPSASLTDEAVDLVLNLKGQVSEITFQRQQVLDRTDPVVREITDSLRLARRSLAEAMLRPSPGDETTRAAERKDLQGRIARWDGELAVASSAYAGLMNTGRLSAAEVTGRLPEGAILVEFFKYEDIDLGGDSAEESYLAALVSAEGKNLVDLGPAAPVDSLVDVYRNHMMRLAGQTNPPTRQDLEEYSAISAALYGTVIMPLEPFLAGYPVVVIAPDGGLNLVSFAGLVGGEGQFLADRYTLHYVTSGRDLLRRTDSDPHGSGLLAIGDPDFDADIAARLGSSAVASAHTGQPTYSATYQYVRSGCDPLNSLVVGRLPDTRREIDRITKIWQESLKEPVSSHVGASATEDIFKAEASGERVIHLATHGVFLGSKCYQADSLHRSAPDSVLVSENPLLLCGLLLAGANLHGAGADSAGCEDGFLAAYEVIDMDLSAADLVVLSACESGIGKVQDGEGMYSLHRAFQQAGAKAVVSALWKVSDGATARVMTELYRFGEAPLYERLNLAQQKLRRQLQDEGLAPHPYLWAGFIAIGDWR